MATYLINGQAPEALGVELCRRTRRNQSIDVVSLRVTTQAGITGALPFAYDAAVTITRDGVGWFKGWVMSPIVSGQAGYEGMSIEIGGPWWHMTRLTYTQLTLPEGGERTARFLHSLSGGVRQTTLEMLNDVLDYTVGNGAGFQVGSLALDEVKPPRATKVDRRCDELVISALEWHPDVVTWFDYSTTPPTFNLTKRGAMGAVTEFDFDGDGVERCEPVPRPDLVTSGVVIRYERGGVVLSVDGMRPAVLVDDHRCGPDSL